MSCAALHELAHTLPRQRFPLALDSVPADGLVLFFEQEEIGHGGDRIVWVGSHTSRGGLLRRLRDHLRPNKNGSILRKTIGAALLHMRNDPYLTAWAMSQSPDLPPVKQRLINPERQREIEEEVSEHVWNRLSFVALPMPCERDRKHFKTRIVATVARCRGCGPSRDWLGLSSPSEAIRSSGLWQVEGCEGTPLHEGEIESLQAVTRPGCTGAATTQQTPPHL
jgi:hypothetical protein